MSLGQELKMRRPFSSVEEEALLSVFVTWDLIYQNLHRTMCRHGLTLAQYNVLRILRGAGEDGLPLMSIAKRMIVRYPNVTRLTDRLEADGLIRRERSTQDRRVVRGFVTDAGKALLSMMDPEMEKLHIELMRGARVEDLKFVIQILEQVRTPLRQNESVVPLMDEPCTNGDGSDSDLEDHSQ